MIDYGKALPNFCVVFFKETFAKNFDQGACRESEQNDRDNGSTRSTSSNFEPFATDDLGKHQPKNCSLQFIDIGVQIVLN